MFRSDLKNRLEKIFGFKKTTFSVPSDSFEQDTLFIEISECRSKAGFGHATAYVTGTLIVYSQDDKLPFGYFNKRIQKASPELTAPLFFFDIDINNVSSGARIQNISERRTRFVFLYSEQYDPNQGSMTSIDLEESA